MNNRQIIEGLQTLQPFYDKPEGYNIGAEHDAIHAYATQKPLTPEALQKMIDLGWFQEDADYDKGDDFKPEHYDPEQSWTAYV